MNEVIVTIFGDKGVGKSSVIERCKPVCPFCSHKKAMEEFALNHHDQIEDLEEFERKKKETGKVCHLSKVFLT